MKSFLVRVYIYKSIAQPTSSIAYTYISFTHTQEARVRDNNAGKINRALIRWSVPEREREG